MTKKEKEKRDREQGKWWAEMARDPRRTLEKLLRIECCHVTGMHDPNHTGRYTCDIQKRHAYDRIIVALGLAPTNVSAKDCGWCALERGEK